MPPISKRVLSPKINKNIYELLVKSFSKADKGKDLLPFMSDLLTPTEQVMISKRLAIALLLLRKDYDQRGIAKTLKVSTSTIARVNLILNTKGAGYKSVLYKIMRDENLKVLLVELYDLFFPIVSINPESRKSYRQYQKRNLKSF